MRRRLFFITFTIALLTTGCTSSGGLTNNYSYDVGYDVGISGLIGQTRGGTESGTASAACKIILKISANSTTTDGIPWADLVEKDYLEGCLEGTRQAYPGADWIK